MENNNANQPHPSVPPTSTQGVMDVHAPTGPQPAPTNPPVPQPPTTHHVAPEHPEKDQPPSPSHKNGTPKTVIVLALLIALSLAAMAVVIFMNQNRKQPKDHHDDSEQTQHSTPATTKDVDDTTQSVDEATKAADTAEELPEDDLSNQTLGL